MSDDQVAGTLSRLIAQRGSAAPLREARRQFERSYIVAVLEQHDWHVAKAAKVLGLQRPNLYRKARQLQIDLRRSAADD
jgi:transcriptional regulator with GAF, ATPase, and Fis domain